MNPKLTAALLKALLAAGAAGLALAYFFICSAIGTEGIAFPEFGYLVLPGYIAVGVSAVPCVVSLCLFWKAGANVAKGRAYCKENAKALGTVSKCAAFDSALCIAVSAVLCGLGAFNGGTLFVALLAVLGGVSVSALCLALSKAVGKVLRECPEGAGS
jgi:hypothetical protein